MAVHPVRVDGAKLLGALLANDLWDRIAPFAHTRRTVRTHLKQNQQCLIGTNISSIAAAILVTLYVNHAFVFGIADS